MKIRSSRSALAVAGVLGLAASLSACSGLLGSQVATAEVGACANYSDLTGEITDIKTVDCTEEHDSQFVHKFDLPDGDFPADIDTLAEEGCLAGFAEFVGTDYDSSELLLTYIKPTEQTWDQANDREVLCVAYLDGSTTTESFEGSAR